MSGSPGGRSAASLARSGGGPGPSFATACRSSASSDGPMVTARNLDGNGGLAAGASATFGVMGTTGWARTAYPT